MASVLSSNEHNNDSQRPEVYTTTTQRLYNTYTTPTQHLRCVRSLSESRSDRDQKRNKNKNVTRRVLKVECQNETPIWYHVQGKRTLNKTNHKSTWGQYIFWWWDFPVQVVLTIGLPVLLTPTLIPTSRMQLRGRGNVYKDPDWWT